MLDPSSSEESDDRETAAVEETCSEGLHSLLGSVDQRSLSAASGGSGDNVSLGGGSSHLLYRTNSVRPSSPSPSLVSERDQRDQKDQRDAELDKSEKEEEDRKKRMHLYVFVMRCIAYPFNAKQPTDMVRRQTKVTKQYLQTTKEKFQSFLKGELNIPADEAFMNAVQSYYEVFLKSDRVVTMVRSGCASANDFREVFKNNVEKRIRSLPEIEGLTKDTVLNSWMAKFDQIFRGDEDPRKWPQRVGCATSEMILSKEQLYEMFQNILVVKKYEHQILYNALQVCGLQHLCFASIVTLLNCVRCCFEYYGLYIYMFTCCLYGLMLLRMLSGLMCVHICYIDHWIIKWSSTYYNFFGGDNSAP